MLFRIDFDIAIYPDRVQVADERAGRFVDHAAQMPFSSKERLVANPIYFEHALANAVKKMMSGGYILYDAKATITGGASELSEDCRQVVRRSLRDIGFKTVRFEGDAPFPERADRRDAAVL